MVNPVHEILLHFMTAAQKEIRKFFGKKNFKGIYSKNPLAFTPDYHKFDKKKAFLTSYPVRAQHQIDRTSVDWPAVFAEKNVNFSRKPFSENEYTVPNKMIGTRLRETLVSAHERGESVQQLSFRFGISVPRVDAVIRLDGVRREAKKQQIAGTQQYLRKDIEKMAKTMTSLFDEIAVNDKGLPFSAVDNLTEIPMPKETRKQMFQSIAESEPFGPVDAANILGIEPAKTTLEKLTNIEVESEHDDKTTPKSKNAFFAEQVEGERHLFRFTDAKVGKVGYHYGSARDDQKSARRVEHRPDGSVAYPLPENS